MKHTILSILQRAPLNPETNCWLYEKVNYQGYPLKIALNKKNVLIHRAVYEFVKGEIPNTWSITHTCKSRNCVNPDHLKAGLPWEINPLPIVKRRNTLITILMNTKIDLESGCWEWQRSLKGNGYGQTTFEGKQHSVHRLIYEKVNKVELTSKDFICHRCDNPICCRPEHLFLGTALDNSRDMVSKHRYANPVITKEQKEEIIQLRKSGVSQRQVAKQFNVAKGVVATATKGLLVTKAVRPSKKVVLYSELESHEFSSIRKAAKFLNTGHSTLIAAIRGGWKTHGYTIEVES